MYLYPSISTCTYKRSRVFFLFCKQSLIRTCTYRRARGTRGNKFLFLACDIVFCDSSFNASDNHPFSAPFQRILTPLCSEVYPQMQVEPFCRVIWPTGR